MTLGRVVLMPLSLTNTSLRPKICGGIQEISPAEDPQRLSNAGGEAYPERVRIVLSLEMQARRLGGASIREIPVIRISGCGFEPQNLLRAKTLKKGVYKL